LDLIKGEPGGRRRAVNGVLIQVDPDYADALARYQRLLEERNAALRQIRDGAAKPSVLEPWDLSLLKEGALLTLARQKFMDAFGPRVQWPGNTGCPAGAIAGRLIYRPSFHVPAEEPEAVMDANRRRLAELREGEIALGSTLIGPHRDDVEFRLDDEIAKARASQGQARTLALAWKWEERLTSKSAWAVNPCACLDDVFSELDPDRRGQLTDLLTGGAQCFVTVTDLSAWGAADTTPAAVFEIHRAGENAVRR
jgi:DNA replication and repair protein RecF